MLLAVGFSGVCLSATLFGIWTSARRDNFLLTWAAGVLLLVGHVLVYWHYVQAPSPALLPALLAGLQNTPIAAVGPVMEQALAAHGLKSVVQPQASFHLRPLVRAIACWRAR